MQSSESIQSIHYWSILKRRWLPASAVFAFVVTISLLATSLRKPAYLAEGKLRVNRTSPTSSLTGLGTEFGDLEPLAQESNPLATEAEVIRSLPAVQETIDRLNLQNEEGDPLQPKGFLQQLSVEAIRGTDILQVSYETADPNQASEVVNTLMNVYLENNILSNRAEAVAAREFIEKQLPQAGTTVSETAAALRQFKEINNIVALQEEATAAVEVITDLQQQITQAQSQMVDAKARSETLRNQLDMNSQQAVATTSVSQSPGVQNVLTQLQQVESELAVQRTIFQEIHPTIANLKAQKASLESLLQERVQAVPGSQTQQPGESLYIGELQQSITADLVELEAQRQGLADQVTTLSQLQNAYRQRAKIIPRLEQRQRELERQLEAAQSTYSLLLQKFQEIRLAENQNVGNVRILAQAQVPEEPVSSGRLLYLAAGLLGLLTAAGTIYVLEATDKSIKTLDEVRELFGYTLLGVIPEFGKLKKASFHDEDSERFAKANFVRDYPRSHISEAYRMLRSNLKFVSADKQLKVIVVTSSIPQEGKSTVSANLAIAMAQLGRKVLLVDGDLHRPVLHRSWELRNDLGLSNVLVGEVEPRMAIKGVMDHLDVLTSGVVPPSPADLLDSQRMASLIERFSANYDFVIIDTPSLNAAADAAILGRMADGCLLVVRPGVIDPASAAFSKELLRKSGQTVLGLVVNGVTPKNEPRNYYYFSKEYYAEDKVLQKASRF